MFLLTGDNQHTALAIGKQVRIEHRKSLPIALFSMFLIYIFIVVNHALVNYIFKIPFDFPLPLVDISYTLGNLYFIVECMYCLHHCRLVFQVIRFCGSFVIP